MTDPVRRLVEAARRHYERGFCAVGDDELLSALLAIEDAAVESERGPSRCPGCGLDTSLQCIACGWGIKVKG